MAPRTSNKPGGTVKALLKARETNDDIAGITKLIEDDTDLVNWTMASPLNLLR